MSGGKNSQELKQIETRCYLDREEQAALSGLVNARAAAAKTSEKQRHKKRKAFGLES
jgi:hypothetical protein